MKNSLFKYLNISYLFFLCSILNSNIVLDENDVIQTPLPLPYNAQIYNGNDIEDFIRTTIEDNKQPILIFGANWCPDCQILSAVLSLPTVKKFMDQHFSVILIDLGRYEINMNLLELVGISQKDGVPRVVIFDKNRKATNLETNDIWRTARDRSPQEIFDYFQSYNEDG